MRRLRGAKKKGRHKSYSGTDQNKCNCNVAESTEKRVVFYLPSTRSCSKYAYTLCVAGSESWTFALLASYCIQIRTEGFTPLSSEWAMTAAQPRAVSDMWGISLLFQYTVKWLTLLILICLPLHKEEHSFGAETGWCCRVTFPDSYPVEPARGGALRQEEWSQCDVHCLCSIMWVGERLR